jgi:hypothetical protein
MRTSILVCSSIVVLAVGAGIVAGGGAESRDPNLLAFENSSGQLRTFNRNGAVDLNNPFFQDLGTNGRRCASCHQPAAVWSITPDNVRERSSLPPEPTRSFEVMTARTAKASATSMGTARLPIACCYRKG